MPRPPASSSPSAASTGRSPLDFGCGFAPGGWDALTRHLRGKGFTQAELVTGGLAKESSRGTLIDRFHRRLVWPIRDITGDVIGFGARKLMDDDPGPKYLNTPETPLYKKSTVLYGIERAKRDIARKHQAVVVEGYTDVMACHLAGVTTAVASCGTAFGGEHISVLRRLLMDQDEFRGEVVYTFDGDAAGQAAAMKTFAEDQRFVGQTFVAVEPNGHDPCELRQEHGDAAVRDLIARRTPLIEFVLKTTLAEYDLDTVEGRVHALEKTAPLLAQIKDHALRPAYARRLAGLLGLPDETDVMERLRRLTGDGGRATPAASPRPAADAGRRRDRGRARGGEGGAAGARGRRTVVRRRPARGLHRPRLRGGGRGRRRRRGSGGRDRHRSGLARRGRRALLPGVGAGDAHRAGCRADAVGGRGRLDVRQRRDGPAAGDGHRAPGRRAQGQAAADEPGRGARGVHEGLRPARRARGAGAVAAGARDGRADPVSLRRPREARGSPGRRSRCGSPSWRRPTPTSGCSPGARWSATAAGSSPPRGGCAVVPPQVTSVTDAEVLPWHEIGSAKWLATSDGGGRFEVVRLAEVEPGRAGAPAGGPARAQRRR